MRLKLMILSLGFLFISLDSFAWNHRSAQEVRNVIGGDMMGFEPQEKYILNGSTIDLDSKQDILEQFCPEDSMFYFKMSDFVYNDFIPWADAEGKSEIGALSMAFYWEYFRDQWIEVVKKMRLCAKIRSLIKVKERVKYVDVSAATKVKLYELLDGLEVCLESASEEMMILSCVNRHRVQIDLLIAED